MPLAAADVFVCTGIGDTPLHTILPVQRPPVLREAWLVLLFCQHCLYPRRRYCSQHNATNWWLSADHHLGRKAVSYPKGPRRDAAAAGVDLMTTP